MKQRLVNPMPLSVIKKRFKFDYRLGLLTLLFIFLGVSQIIAQTFTDNFESETTGATTFSEGGVSFTTNGSINIGFFANAGFGGAAGPPANDSRFLEAANATGNVGEVIISTANRVFQLEMMAIWLSTIPLGDLSQSGTITFAGTPDGGGAVIPVTFNINPPNTNSWEVIDFAGTALAGVNLSKFEVILGPGIQYMAIDNFKFTHLDASIVSLTIDDVSVVEGNSGTTNFVFFAITRTNNSSTFMVTAASADGTASSATDYTPLAATNVNFTTGGSLTQTVSVPVFGDSDPEFNETFFVNLTNATNGVEIIDPQGIGTILDDDRNCETFEDEPEDATTFTQNGISFSTTDQLAIGFFAPGGAGSGQSDFYLESNIDNDPHAGSVGQIQLTTPNKVFEMLTVDLWLSTDGDPDTPEDGSVDFIGTLASGGTVTATLTTTGSGSTWVQGISFAGTPLDGALLSALEVVLPAGVHYIAIDNFKYATFDETAVLVSIDDVCLNEGNSGNTIFTFTVSRSDVTTAFDVTVQSSIGTATPGSDYLPFGPVTLNFAANGPASQTVDVQVIGDLMSEIPETFFMNLSNATNGVIISDGQGEGTIKDDDTICETFEDEATVGLTVFSEPGVAFSTTGSLVTGFFAPGGGGGGGSDYYLESPGALNSGSVGSITVTTPNTALNLLRLDLWLSNDADPDTQEAGMVQLVATLAGGGTLTTTLSTTSSSSYTENILLTDFTGNDIVAIEVILLGTSNYVSLDNICFEVIDLLPFICPTVGAVSSTETDVCIDAPFNLTATGLADMDLPTNTEQDFGIEFVAFTSTPADPYTGGTSLGTIPFASLTGGNTTAALVGASLAASGSYEIYAILSPAPTDATCRPAAMTSISVNPLPTVSLATALGYCLDANIANAPITGGSPSGGVYSGPGVTDLGNGLSYNFDPMLAGVGTHVIEYTITDVNGCINTAMSNLEVFDCGFSIDDPCACLDNASVVDLDAGTGGDDGQFSEVVSITAAVGALPAGQTWTVTAQTGAFDAFNIPAVGTPSAGIPVLTDGTVTLNFNGGIYEIPFVHVDGIGYSISIEGPFPMGSAANVTLSISNKCAYPNPLFDPVLSGLGLCIMDAAVMLGASESSGIAPDGVTFTIDGNPATVFDPTVVGGGDHTVVMTYDGGADANGGISPDGGTTPANPGCIQTVQQVVNVNPICCMLNVTCPTGPVALQSIQDLPSIATPANVLSEFTSRGGVVIESCDPVVITASDADDGAAGCIGTPRTITRTFTVTDPVTGASQDCPVDYVITDTTPPVVTCTEFSMTFNACPNPIFPNTPNGSWISVPASGTFPTAVGGSFIQTVDLNGCVMDNFSAIGDLEWTLVSSFEENRIPGCSVDIINELGIRDNCENESMTTIIVRSTLQFGGPAPVITCPANLTVECGDPTDPAATGMATATSDCGMPAITFTDVSVPGCGLTEVITRTWTATDGCGTMTNCDQIITIEDTTPPVVTCAEFAMTFTACPDPIFPNTPSGNWFPVPASGTFPTAVGGSFITTIDLNGCVTDVCSNFEDMEWELVSSFEENRIPGCSVDIINEIGIRDGCLNEAITTIISRSTIQFGGPAPVITCPANLTVECGDPTDPAATGMATATSDCGSPSITFTDVSVPGCGSTEVITRTWTATDGCGVVSTCDQVITIIDTTPPVAPAAPADIMVQCASDVTEQIDLTAVDNCDGDITVASSRVVTPGGCPNQFTEVRTWTFVDGCGNTSAISQTIIVNDDTVPVAPAAPADVIVQCATDLPAIIALTAIDNCDDIVMAFPSILITPGTCPNQFTELRTWTFIDNCGNASSVSQTITVNDDTAPVITCAGDITIECDEDTSPANTGMATGTDNCSTDAEVLITFNDLSTQTATGCGQYMYTITRTWTATDACGNESTCVQVITVEDSTDPIITCPADQTLVCNTDPIPTASTIADFITIGGTASDNCAATSELTVSFVDSPPFQAQLNFCSADPADRTLIRTYTVTDACGNSSTCAQNFVYNQSILDPVITAVPADQTVDCAVNAFPQVHLFSVDTDCGLGQTVTVSEAMTSGTPGCSGSTIRYTYTSTDVCGRSVSHTQTYTLANEGPQFICPVDICVIECPADTDMIQTQFDNYAELATVISSCSETSISIGNNFNPNGFINQNCMNPTVAVPGAVAYQIVRFTATDACGRNATCTAMVVITDGDGPVMTGNVSFGLADCNDTDLQQGYTNWATSQLNGLSATDECSNGTVNFSYTPLTPNVDCSSGLASTEVSFIASDACGNETIITAFYRIIDNGTEPVTATVSGNILTEDDEMIALATIEAEGFSNHQMMTNDDGYYHFDLAMMQNYSITPSRNDDPLNGITTFDLILMGQHLLEIITLDSPYKMIAADVNESGHISSLDMIELRRLILHIDDQFSSGKSWTFVDAGYVFPQPTNPFSTTFPTVYNINNLTNSEIVDFIGVKLGDLNASADVSLLAAGDTRSFDGNLNIKLEDQELKASQTYELAFKASDFKDVAGFQFTLDFAADYLELMDYQGSELTNMSTNNFGFTKAKEGKITVSWNENELVSLADDATIFKMQFTALKEVRLSEILSINSSLTPNEAYQADLRKEVKLVFESSNLDADRFILFQNQPNPFKQETVIGFQLSEAADATLTIFDVAGRVIWTQTEAYETGMHQVMVSKDQLDNSGVFYYQLSTGKQTATKKMILLQ